LENVGALLMSNEQENPLVSVVIPTYKRPDMLGRAIDSVLNQTYDNIEIIVVDDNDENSKYRKETEEFMRKYADVDNLVYLKHKNNSGAAAARNTGMKYSKGEFISFLDDDDEWYNDKTQIQVSQFRKLSEDYGVVYTNSTKKNDINNIFITNKENKNSLSGDVHNKILKGNFIGTPVAMIRSSCYEKNGGFDESLPRLQDWEFWIRLSKNYKFKYIDKPMTMVSELDDTISTNINALIKSLKIILEKHYSEFENAGEFVLANKYFLIGHNLCLNNKCDYGREYFKNALKIKFKIKFFVVFIFSFFGRSFYKLFFYLWKNIRFKS
jgi:glycosyltransferase involved in cell wall biosynthesis